MNARTILWYGVLLALSACGNGSASYGPESGGDGKGDGTGSGPGDGNGSDGGGSSATCEEVVLQGERAIPNVLVVLDRSGSMADDSRWNQAVSAINNVVGNLEDGIAFGLMLYSGGAGCGDIGEVVVTPRVGAADAIASELDDAYPSGGTPTALSLLEARDALADLEGSSYVLLVTDGAPNCNGALDYATCTCTVPGACTSPAAATHCLDDVRSVDAVTQLAGGGVSTYVIGFDTGAFEEAVLTDMAVAGATGATGYTPVSDGATLEASLDDLAGTVIQCSYTLDSTPSDYRFVRVQLDGANLPHTSQTGDGSGWELLGNRIEVRGASCDALKANPDSELRIQVECELVLL